LIISMSTEPKYMPPLPSGIISLMPLIGLPSISRTSHPDRPLSGWFHMIPPSPDESTAPSSFIITPPVHMRSGLNVATLVPSGFTPWMPPAMTSLYQTTLRA
jgi:hypothetical protein